MDIYRCRFVDYTPASVTALAFSHKSSFGRPAPKALRLAVGRANGDIEVWSPFGKWTHEMTLPGGRGRAVEGLVWGGGAQPRLFSIGGLTYITEWDLQTHRPRANYDCNAGVVWCMDVNASGDKLAVGCDDGLVVIVDISGGPGVMEHDMICQRQDQRVLGLCFYGDEMVVGGCADAQVRCWNVAPGSDGRGRIRQLMRVDRARTEPTLVWSVVPFPELRQFATGDSTGSVKVWDANTFTLVNKFSVHEADVLTMARTGGGDKFFSAGIDRRIHQFSCIGNKKQRKWLHNCLRLLHANDVRGMAAYEGRGFNVLVSGGVERSFIVQQLDYFEDGKTKKVLMDQQVSNIAHESESRHVALFQDQHVKIWFLGDSHKLVAKLSLADDDSITSVAIGGVFGSEPAQIVAVATINSVKLFVLRHTGATSRQIVKIRDDAFAEAVAGAKRVWMYRPDRLLIHTPEDEFYTWAVLPEGAELLDEIETVGSEVKSLFEHHNAIRTACVTPDGAKLVVARYNDAVEVLPLEGKFKPYVLTKPLTSVHLIEASARNTLFVLTQECKLYEFDLSGERLLTPWSERNSEIIPDRLVLHHDRPMGMFVEESRVWLYGASWTAFISLDANLDSRNSTGKRTRDGLSVVPEDESPLAPLSEAKKDKNTVSPRPYWMTEKYRSVLKVFPLGNEEVAVVERDAFALPTGNAFEVARYRA